MMSMKKEERVFVCQAITLAISSSMLTSFCDVLNTSKYKLGANLALFMLGTYSYSKNLVLVLSECSIAEVVTRGTGPEY
jgi:hypothetical protein